jgi:hypothetical protein
MKYESGSAQVHGCKIKGFQPPASYKIRVQNQLKKKTASTTETVNTIE